MADLIDKAPTTEAPATPPAEPTTTEAAPPQETKQPKGLDPDLERAIAAEKGARDAQREADKRLKQAQDLETKYSKYSDVDVEKYQRFLAIEDQLTKGERAAALKQLFGGRIDEDVLFDLATAMEPPEELTVEQQVERALAAKEAAAEKKRLDDEAARVRTEQEAAQKQVNDYLTNSANFLKENLDRFPYLKTYGCDSSRFTELSIEWSEANNAPPEPETILKLLEKERRDEWLRSPEAPKQEAPRPVDLDDYVAQTYRKNKPPGATIEEVARPKTPAEQAREELRKWDREQAERLRYR